MSKPLSARCKLLKSIAKLFDGQPTCFQLFRFELDEEVLDTHSDSDFADY